MRALRWLNSLSDRLTFWSETRAEQGTERKRLLAQNEVEVIEAKVRGAVMMQDDEMLVNTWLLQVDDDAIMVFDHPVEHPTDTLRVVHVPASGWALEIAWSGDRIEPARPPRRLRYGEVMPEAFSIVKGHLNDLDTLLLAKKALSGGKVVPRHIDELADLGFFKFADHVDMTEWDALMRDDWEEFTRASGRLFDGDLADGGGAQELVFMAPALKSEGVTFGTATDRIWPNRYSIDIDGTDQLMWSEEEIEARRTLTVERFSVLVNERLIQAGSSERVFVVSNDFDNHLVLMSPAMKAKLSELDVFDKSLEIKWLGSAAPAGALSIPAFRESAGALSVPTSKDRSGALSESDSGPTRPG